MTATPPQAPTPLSGAEEQMFPTLTPAQVARLAAVGRSRPMKAGEVLQEFGESNPHAFIVTAGRLEIVRPREGIEDPVSVLGVGQFTGEVGTLSGRRSLVRIRAVTPGEVIELDRERLLTIVQTESELSEVLMRSFLLRRGGMVERGLGDAVLLGSDYCAATIRIREFLTRNSHPFTYIDLDREDEVQVVLDHFDVSVDDIPVLICRGEVTLRNPTNRQIADCLGFNEDIDQTQVRDLVVVGAGPAGLAAAVYAASEGLDVLVLETDAPGGQAGSSSRIENYLGFPSGISGQELTVRAQTQAQKFGAHLMIAKGATRLACGRKPYAVELDDGPKISARAIIIATGAKYRRLALDDIARFEGAGMYFGATRVESQLCHGEEVIVVGGGNSAGQAAVYLADTARHVHVLVRSEGLNDSMSRYLIRRIDQNPAITLRTRTEIAALEGERHLERVSWREHSTGTVETHEIRHVFVMAGAVPNTQWLDGCMALDPSGFIKTGSDLSASDLATASWPLARAPHLLETSLPGVFAVGDVRSGNLKRVASAVGEGAIAVSLVHRALHE